MKNSHVLVAGCLMGSSVGFFATSVLMGRQLVQAEVQRGEIAILHEYRKGYEEQLEVYRRAMKELSDDLEEIERRVVQAEANHDVLRVRLRQAKYKQSRCERSRDDLHEAGIVILAQYTELDNQHSALHALTGEILSDNLDLLQALNVCMVNSLPRHTPLPRSAPIGNHEI